MSVAVEDQVVQPVAPARAAGDTLAASVVVMLAMTALQRLVGFGRGIVFCRWLEPEQLGQWDVALAFLNLAAPVAVLGLPGAFGRYVEYFRCRGQFHTFLKRTTATCAVMGIVATATILYEREWFSQLIFGSLTQDNLVIWLAACLAAIIVQNFLTSLFVAVRRYRIVTVLQFVQSVGFAVLSLSLLAARPEGAASVVAGYFAATMLATALALAWLRGVAAGEPRSAARLPQSTFWAKLIPFAMWMWVTNLLANLFDLADRYMIVHHSGMDADEALRQVGYYHSSRLIPLLFVTVAALLGMMITPHLSHDWEHGRREAVVRRLNLALKLLLTGLLAVSVAVLFVAPWLFDVAFQNKFAGGLAVLPWTLAYCAWFGTIALAQNYLWCAERPGLCSLALLIGLLLNVCANVVLMPRYGLEGAVWATTLANFAALGLTYFFSARTGMRIDGGTWIVSLAPLSLGLGPWPALGVLAVIVAMAVATKRLLRAGEKRTLRAGLRHSLEMLSAMRHAISGRAT